MKRVILLFLLTILGAGVQPARADISVGFSVGDRWPEHHRRYVAEPYAYAPAWRHGWVRPYRVVVAPAPVVFVPSPYVASPYETPAVAGPSLSGDYGSDLAALHGRAAELRGILERQHEKDVISRPDYERLMNALEDVDHDEHQRSYNRGALSQSDFADLFNRLDQINVDLNHVLAQ